MVYHERGAWAGLIVSVIIAAAYVVVMLRHPDPVGDWVPIMAWTIGAGIVLTIIVTIGWGIVAGIRDREDASASDLRDRDISRMGGRVEHSFLIVAGLAVLVLCALGAEIFWIAQTMFAGFLVSAFVGGVARVIAYRRGLV